jgi:hypothetical protein
MKRFTFIVVVLGLLLTHGAVAQNVYGEMILEFEDGYLFAGTTMPDGQQSWFAIDLAVPTTAVTKAYTGDNQVEKLRSSNDPLARSMFQFALGGFGFTPEFIGKTTLAQLELGGLQFPKAHVNVIDRLPQIAGRPIAGILGVDLLRRAEVAVFTYGSAPRLLLKSKARTQVSDVIEIPFHMVENYIMVSGTLNGEAVDFLFDTGSPDSYLPVKTVRATGAAAVPNSTKEITLLDGETAKVRTASVASFALGENTFTDHPFHIGELPVFKLLPETTTPVLLGNVFFSSMKYVQVNFTTNTVRLKMQ